MTQSTRSRRLATGVAAFLASIAALPARGDTVDASSTTMQIVRDQNRAGQLFTIAPLYELVSISARNVQNPVADDLAFVVSGWAGLSLGTNLVWYDANPPQPPQYRASRLHRIGHACSSPQPPRYRPI